MGPCIAAVYSFCVWYGYPHETTWNKRINLSWWQYLIAFNAFSGNPAVRVMTCLFQWWYTKYKLIFTKNWVVMMVTLPSLVSLEVIIMTTYSAVSDHLASWLLIFSADTQIARFMGPTWGPSGAGRTQVGPMLATWTLLSGYFIGSQNRGGSSNIKTILQTTYTVYIRIQTHKHKIKRTRYAFTWSEELFIGE